jgi:hypothetical protein
MSPTRKCEQCEFFALTITDEGPVVLTCTHPNEQFDWPLMRARIVALRDADLTDATNCPGFFSKKERP